MTTPSAQQNNSKFSDIRKDTETFKQLKREVLALDKSILDNFKKIEEILRREG